MKITGKVAFNIASEASYGYVLLTKNAKNSQFWRVFSKPEACGQTVLPDRSILIEQKMVENAKIGKVNCDILGDFQTLWSSFLELLPIELVWIFAPKLLSALLAIQM